MNEIKKADIGIIGAMGDWLLNLVPGRRVKALYLQPFVDRDTVQFVGLKAPETVKLQNYRELLADCAEETQIRGI